MTDIDFGPMTDREILVGLAVDVRAIKDAVYGPPSLASRLDRAETLIDERTTSKKGVAGLAGLVSVAVTAILEALRRAQQ